MDNHSRSPFELPAVSQLTDSPVIPTVAAKLEGKGKAKEEEPEEQGDAVALRLRKYATLNISPTTHGESTLALSGWGLSADPDDITWHMEDGGYRAGDWVAVGILGVIFLIGKSTIGRHLLYVSFPIIIR